VADNPPVGMERSTMPFTRLLGLADIRVHAAAEDGQALVEYALLLALIAIVTVGAVQVFGGNLSTLYQSILDAVPSL
jgi:Flp pilus assembly pilin Flp